MTAVVLMLHVVGGAALGTLYFGSLWWNTRRFGHGGGILTLLAGIATRFVLLGIVLWATSLEGAMPLLATGLGVLLARTVVTRRVRTMTP